MKQSLKSQELDLKRVAKQLGLKIRPDKRLTSTPYRAMNPMAAHALHMPCGKHEIGWDPLIRENKRQRLMDIRHEEIEFEVMSEGKSYRAAHKIANRRQRTVGAEKRFGRRR